MSLAIHLLQEGQIFSCAASRLLRAIDDACAPRRLLPGSTGRPMTQRSPKSWSRSSSRGRHLSPRLTQTLRNNNLDAASTATTSLTALPQRRARRASKHLAFRELPVFATVHPSNSRSQKALVQSLRKDIYHHVNRAPPTAVSLPFSRAAVRRQTQFENSDHPSERFECDLRTPPKVQEGRYKVIPRESGPLGDSFVYFGSSSKVPRLTAVVGSRL